MGIRIEYPETEWVEYVPDVLDNRDDPEPMSLEIRPMTISDLREMQTTQGRRLAGKDADRRAVRLVTRILTERVRNVRNCYVGREITTGAELAEYGLSAIIDDVFSAIIDISKLQDSIKKNSGSPSGSSPAAM